jgi:hypothetical protein
MTHSLHRRGDVENLQNDFIVFAMSAKGVNDAGSAAQMKRFFQIARRHHPLNMGDMKTGNWSLIDEKILRRISGTLRRMRFMRDWEFDGIKRL